MPINRLTYRYNFHPVGQGIFATGVLYPHNSSKRNFTWAYDCGTSSDKWLLDDAIHNFQDDISNNTINLVAISHFDNDHINGIIKLISGKTVDYMLLPYIPLYKRLEIALHENTSIYSNIIDFYINPIAYISSFEGVNIRKFILVPPSSGESSPTESYRDTRPLTDEGGWGIYFNKEEHIDKDIYEDIPSLGEPSMRDRVILLKRGSAITLRGIWEFVPYNDTTLTIDIPPNFYRTVKKYKSALLVERDNKKRELALSEIKNCYDNIFGKSSKQRNIISLFMYTGPIDPKEIQGVHAISRSLPIDFELCEYLNYFYPLLSRCSAIYTGDGYLNTTIRTNCMTNYFGEQRMNSISLFQIMHHGSKYCWHDGLAEILQPDVSIICSDPFHRGLRLPDKEVLRDFWPYHPKQVDTKQGFIFCGCLDY